MVSSVFPAYFEWLAHTIQIYGFAPTDITSQLQSYLYTQTGLSGCTDLACLQAKSVDDILTAQGGLNQMAPYMFTGVPFSFGMSLSILDTS